MEKHKVNKGVAIFLIAMTVLSFANLIKIEIDGELLKLAGLTVIIGIVAFFVTRRTNGSKYEGLNIKTFLRQFKNKKVILLMLAPIVFDVATSIAYKSLAPQYFDFLKARLPFDLDSIPIQALLIELLVVPLGEEIALRAFYQKQITKITGFLPALIISSVVFAMGHFSYGAPLIVILDLAGIFIDSLFYGMVFKETDNAWCSWVSHSSADIVALVMIMFIL